MLPTYCVFIRYDGVWCDDYYFDSLEEAETLAIELSRSSLVKLEDNQVFRFFKNGSEI